MILGESKAGREEYQVICTVEEMRQIKEMDSSSYMLEYSKPRIGRVIPEVRFSAFDFLDMPDTDVFKLCKTLSIQKFQSEPVKSIHTNIRILFHASLMLGRPYDINMMATTLLTTPAIVQQALKKWYKNLISQSEVKEEHFVPTYLWILGFPTSGEAHDRIVRAIRKYGDIYDGRSVFSIARDYVIIYYRYYLDLPFTCVPRERQGIPDSFTDALARFESRSKISRRKIFDRHRELNGDLGLLFQKEDDG